MFQPAGSINFGCDRKNNTGNIGTFSLFFADQACEPRSGSVSEFFQTEISQCPVFINNRYDIGGNADDSQVQIVKYGFTGEIQFLSDCLDEFKSDSATTEFFERIATIISFGIQYSNSFG